MSACARWLDASSRADHLCSINVNDPTLIALVNKLQDVFTTVGVCGPGTIVSRTSLTFHLSRSLIP